MATGPCWERRLRTTATHVVAESGRDDAFRIRRQRATPLAPRSGTAPAAGRLRMMGGAGARADAHGAAGKAGGGRTVRALHSADLHFDPPRRSVAELLPLVLDTARERQVALLLLAGDIFDHGRVGEEEVELFLALLAAEGPDLQVALLPGNHDVSIFQGVSRSVPPNVSAGPLPLPASRKV